MLTLDIKVKHLKNSIGFLDNLCPVTLAFRDALNRIDINFGVSILYHGENYEELATLPKGEFYTDKMYKVDLELSKQYDDDPERIIRQLKYKFL